MQELSLSIKERIKKTKFVIQQQANTQKIRNLREQQKVRCERQGFILSMMRSNKVMSSHLKKSYYTNSYELMKLLQPNFQFKLIMNIDEQFLNQFVHLYTHFFNYFETKFTFKTKLKNFLRPTNHNIVVDLIKYFVQFTRDYYVQTLFWKMKNSFKDQNALFLQNKQDLINSKVKPLGSIYKNFSNMTQNCQSSSSPRKKTDQAEQRKNNQKNYDILDVSIPSLTASVYKQNSLNIQSLKMKINELFRQQKSRNGPIRKIYEDYIDEYNSKYKKNENQATMISYKSALKRNDQTNQKCLPYKMCLSIQKNGFSVIMLQIDNKKFRNSYFDPSNRFRSTSNVSSQSNSPSKINQNGLSTLKVSQRLSHIQQSPKGDYFLTSMKVLRVSQNFLPPLISNGVVINNWTNSKRDLNEKQMRNDDKKDKGSIFPFSIKLQKMDDEIDGAVPLDKEPCSENNGLVPSTSYNKSTIQKQKKRIQSYKNQIYMGQYQHQRQQIQKKSKRKESQDLNYRLSNKRLNFKKKLLVQDRKSYQGNHYSSKHKSKISTQLNQESQEKILQWLQKIKNLKEIQRKKILGMNF